MTKKTKTIKKASILGDHPSADQRKWLRSAESKDSTRVNLLDSWVIEHGGKKWEVACDGYRLHMLEVDGATSADDTGRPDLTNLIPSVINNKLFVTYSAFSGGELRALLACRPSKRLPVVLALSGGRTPLISPLTSSMNKASPYGPGVVTNALNPVHLKEALALCNKDCDFINIWLPINPKHPILVRSGENKGSKRQWQAVIMPVRWSR